MDGIYFEVLLEEFEEFEEELDELPLVVPLAPDLAAAGALTS